MAHRQNAHVPEQMHVPSLIETKRDGGELDADEINYIIANFTRGEIPDYQVSALAMAIFFRGMVGASQSAHTGGSAAASGDVEKECGFAALISTSSKRLLNPSFNLPKRV